MHRQQPQERPAPRTRGVSMVEIMVTIAVAALLLGIGAPSMVASIRQHQLRGVRDELLAALQLAELEAMRRSSVVLLSRVTSCSVALTGDSDWSCGYTVSVDANANGAQDSDEPSVKVFEVPPNVRLNHAAGGTDTVRMNPWGKVNGAQRFVLSTGSSTATVSATVCMNTAGRARTLDGSVTCP